MSDNPKSKGKAASTKKTAAKEVNINRMLNVGQEVTLTIGKYTVKELSVFDLIASLSDGLEIFVSLTDEENASELELLRMIVSNKDMQVQVCRLIALCCQSNDFELFKQMTTTDLLKVIKVIKEVIDFEELKETFFELGLQKYLTNQTPISTEL